MSIALPTEASVLADPYYAQIAEAAYYRAEGRGFQGGCPVHDWLATEREIRQPSAPSGQTRRMALVSLHRRSTVGESPLTQSLVAQSMSNATATA